MAFNNPLIRRKLRTTYNLQPLHRLADSFSGGTPSKTVAEYWQGEIPWVSPKDFTDTYIEDSEDHISEEGMKAARLKPVPSNSVLMVVRSGILQHTLPITVNTVNVTINQDIKALIPNEGVSAEYLAFYFTALSAKLLPVITKHGATVQSVNTAQLDSLQIPVPPPQVQEELVTYMKAARASRQAKVAHADELLDGLDDYLLDQLHLELPAEVVRPAFAIRFQDIVNGRLDPHFHEPRFGVLAGVIESGPYQRLGNLVQFSAETWKPEESEDEIFCYIEIANVDLHTGEVNPSLTLVDQAPSRARMIVREGDIIVSTTRPHHGAIALIDIDLNNCIASTGFAVIRGIAADQMNREYLWCILKSKLCLHQMLQRSSGGNYPAITQDELAQVLIPLPPLNLQNTIAIEVQRRREVARRLKAEAEAEWQAAKRHFERQLLGEEE